MPSISACKLLLLACLLCRWWRQWGSWMGCEAGAEGWQCRLGQGRRTSLSFQPWIKSSGQKLELWLWFWASSFRAAFSPEAVWCKRGCWSTVSSWSLPQSCSNSALGSVLLQLFLQAATQALFISTLPIIMVLMVGEYTLCWALVD